GSFWVLPRCHPAPNIFLALPAPAFVPPRKVTSGVSSTAPRPEPLAPAEKSALERVTAAAFGQRRKMLRTSLKTLGIPVEPLLDLAEVPPTVRAEELTVAQFCALARALQPMQSDPREPAKPDLH